MEIDVKSIFPRSKSTRSRHEDPIAIILSGIREKVLTASIIGTVSAFFPRLCASLVTSSFPKKLSEGEDLFNFSLQFPIPGKSLFLKGAVSVKPGVRYLRYFLS